MEKSKTIVPGAVAPGSSSNSSPGAVPVLANYGSAAAASSSAAGSNSNDNENEVIQKLLSGKGYQIDDNDVDGTATEAVVEVVPTTTRYQRFQQDLLKERTRKNSFLAICVIITILELVYVASGGDGDGWLSLFLGLSVGINSFGFAFISLLLWVDYRLKHYFIVPVEECTILQKVTKRFCCGSLFRKTYHVLVKYRIGNQSFFKIFATPKSRYDYIRIGDSLDEVYCRVDNPKMVVYQPPERGSHWRWNIIIVGLVCFVLHWINVIVAFIHPKIDKDDALFLLYLTLGLMVFGFPYLLIIVISVARRKIEDYIHVEQATAVMVVHPMEQESLPSAKPVEV